jgi:hypothetical protein
VGRATDVAISCCSAVLAAVAISACGGTPADEIIACVGDVPVSTQAFEHWAPVVAAMTPAMARLLVRDPSGKMTVTQRTTRFLTSSVRTTAEAREQGIGISDREADALLQRLKAEQTSGLLASSSYESELGAVVRDASVATDSDRIWIVKVHILAERLERRQRSDAELEIPRSQVLAYYARHKRAFLIPERRDVAVIQSFTKRNADLARREIEAGRNLLGVVERRNEEPNVGGLKRNLTHGSLRHTYEDDYFAAKPHVLVGPLKSEIYYLFEVTAIKAPSHRTLKTAEPIIRRRLISGSQHRLLTNRVRAVEQKWPINSHCGAKR